MAQRLCFNGERFATRLRRWRDGVPLRILADNLSLSASTLSRLESGYTPDLTVFMNLCADMNADPRDFFFEAEYSGEEI